jgi:hypothetical protein
MHTVDRADTEQRADPEASDQQPSHSDQAQHEHHLVAGLFSSTPKDDHARHVEHLLGGNIEIYISLYGMNLKLKPIGLRRATER